MPQINAYIQLEVRTDETICHIHPAREGGQKLSFKEADDYLRYEGYENYDRKALADYLETDSEETMSVGYAGGLECQERMTVKVSLDRMKATCRFMPPSFGGKVMETRDIIGQLSQMGIVYGLDQDAMLSFASDRCYCTDYVFAQGDIPRPGRDASITYFFNTNPSLKPKHNEDGSVDYRNLNTINEVREGDLLARLIPADRGDAGKDINGKTIPTRQVRAKHLEFGKNIEISEDKTEIFSKVNGHVSLYGTQVFVSDVYEVPADVDNSTGNIRYRGNVHVVGSVRGGFTVEALGDVVVDGVVEDAYVRAGGQIIVKCGIHGKNRGILEARGNIMTKFIENAKVFAGGYVETGSIIYSEVNAGGDILVEERKGFISGGVIRAGGKVSSQTIGSAMGALTRIEVGMAPDKKERYLALQKEISGLNQKIAKINPVLQTYRGYISKGLELDQKNLVYMNRLLTELNEAKETLQKDRVEFNGLHQELLYSKHACVDVRRDIFPGVTICISDLSKTTKDKRSFCRFEKKNGEITVSNL